MPITKTQQNIPNGWKFGELGNFLADIGDGGTPLRSKDEYFGGKIPWVVVNDIKPHIKQTKDTLTDEGLQKSSAKLWPTGSVILSFGATIGEVGIADVPVTTKQGIAGIIPNDDLLNTYLYYLLLSKKNLLHKLSSGSTIKEVRPSVIKTQIEVLIPPIKEQQKIAEILGVVDEDIAKTQEVIETTEKLKRGLMQQLFTRGIGHTKFKETKIGQIPQEWEVLKLKDAPIEIIDGDRGVNYPHGHDFIDPYLTSGGYCLFLNNKNIKDDKFLFNELQFISREKDQALRKGRLQREDVVLTTRGTVGNVAYYDKNVTFENIRINSGMVLLRAFDGVEAVFLYHLMKSDMLKRKYKEIVSGSAQPQLPIGSLEQVYIPIPTEDEQKEIAEILSAVDEKILVNKKLKEKFTLLKKGLMQDLLSGQVRTDHLAAIGKMIP